MLPVCRYIFIFCSVVEGRCRNFHCHCYHVLHFITFHSLYDCLANEKHTHSLRTHCCYTYSAVITYVCMCVLFAVAHIFRTMLNTWFHFWTNFWTTVMKLFACHSNQLFVLVLRLYKNQIHWMWTECVRNTAQWMLHMISLFKLFNHHFFLSLFFFLATLFVLFIYPFQCVHTYPFGYYLIRSLICRPCGANVMCKVCLCVMCKQLALYIHILCFLCCHTICPGMKIKTDTTIRKMTQRKCNKNELSYIRTTRTFSALFETLKNTFNYMKVTIRLVEMCGKVKNGRQKETKIQRVWNG